MELNSIPQMVKYINSTKCKSDKHQAHERKYAASHKQATLERWFEKMTRPRNPIGRPRKDKRNKCNGGPGRDDYKSLIRPFRPSEARMKRDRERAKAFYAANPDRIRTYEIRLMSREDVNIN